MGIVQIFYLFCSLICDNIVFVKFYFETSSRFGHRAPNWALTVMGWLKFFSASCSIGQPSSSSSTSRSSGLSPWRSRYDTINKFRNVNPNNVPPLSPASECKPQHYMRRFALSLRHINHTLFTLKAHLLHPTNSRQLGLTPASCQTTHGQCRNR